MDYSQAFYLFANPTFALTPAQKEQFDKMEDSWQLLEIDSAEFLTETSTEVSQNQTKLEKHGYYGGQELWSSNHSSMIQF